jgi:carbon storage regulator
MLVLSRERNEAIIIRGDIKVVIVDVRGDKVKLGVIAPQDVTVHREEVEAAIKREIAEGRTPRKPGEGKR